MQGLFLLAIIYIAFISLGLPDTVLGVAWPTMRHSLGLPLEAAGIFTMVTTLGTAFSSFVSGHILGKLGTGRVVFASCAMTGLALLGYSASPSFAWLLLLTIPLGIGAGAVDTGLNNYVANNYSSRQMSWLHCFWGVGAFLGPNIMNALIVRSDSWRSGYRIIGFTQLSIALVLLATLPLWKNHGGQKNTQEETQHAKVRGMDLFRKKGVVLSILAFPLYVAVEAGTGLWLGSYLIEGRGMAQSRAGMLVAAFYASITAGRFLNGFIAEKLTNKSLIRIGVLVMCAGVALFNVPVDYLLIPGILLLGLGCAPIFPSMIHQTPRLFGSANSEAITGYQVGMAYLSGVFLTPVIGLLASRVSIAMIPFSIGFFTLTILFITERLNRAVRI
jgi:fucose permease